MSVKMTRYKHTAFADDDVSSIGSVHLTEGISSSTTHIRYHTGGTLWKTRTSLEKVLLVVSAILLFMSLILTSLLSSKNSYELTTIGIKEQPENLTAVPVSSPTLCLSETCIHAASDILRGLDVSVDPCTDFYAFACNGWIKENPIPDGKSIWGTFGKLEQQNQLIVKNALGKPAEQLKSKAEQKAQIYYESCMDTDEVIEKLGSEPMVDLLRRVGGWSMTDTGFNVSTWSLQKTLQKLQNQYNMGGLFSWAVGEDDKNSTRHVIQIDQGGLTLPTRDHYLNRTEHLKVLQAYEEYMIRIVVLLGGNDVNGTIRKQVQDIIAFETKLANASSPPEQRRDEERLYHSMPLAKLEELADFISWTNYFIDALRLVNKKINSKEQVVVYAPEYLKKLSKIVKEYNSTTEGKIVLNNYLVWQTVRSLTACLSRDFRDAYKGLRKALVGSDGGEETWRYCVSDTSNVLGFAVGAMFVREAFRGSSKPLAENMIAEVRDAFKSNLKNLKWMDTETRKSAWDKADAISDMIGFPDFIIKPNQLDEKYEDLDVRKDEYFINNIRVNQYNLKKNLEKLGKVVNRTRWGMTPHTVNAYYTPTKNQIVFPAGILQNPFFDIRNPKSLNLGAMGVIMGHELTHAFDDQGREYDSDGNLNQWWNNATIDRFKKKTECFQKQYDKFEINGKHVNGLQTLGENIADNGGLKAAFHAYNKWEKNNTKSEQLLPLPGLNFTHKQLFFISFAQVWCSAVTQEATNLLIEKDSHAPPMFRVIAPLSNLPEFSEQFSCKLGTKMNPDRKCEVW